MVSPDFRQVLRFFAISGLAGLLLLVSSHFINRQVSAEAFSQPRYQEGYPAETDTLEPTVSGGAATEYPGEGNVTETPAPSATSGAGPTKTAAQATTGPSLTPANTITFTATVPNVFLTENAEMGGSSVTPPASPTPIGTGTLAPTPTLASTKTPLSTATAGADEGGWRLDWGLFWIGFAAPVVAACGVVLYLLDRRPDLFSIKRK